MFESNFTKIFADGASIESIRKHNDNPLIKGFTTNPTLMYKNGVTDYTEFAANILNIIGDKPVSFEVFSDDFDDMARQARIISEWGKNVYVKIPVTNTEGKSSVPLIENLVRYGVKLNVTAITTIKQVTNVSLALGDNDSFISVFAGRVADTGVDPWKLMDDSLYAVREFLGQKLIWASPRQVLDVVMANNLGVHAITITDDIIAKLSLIGKNLEEYSLDTVKMFYTDGQKAGFSL